MDYKLQNFIDINKDQSILKYYLVPLCGIPPQIMGHNRNVDYTLINKAGTEIYIHIKKYDRRMDGLRDEPSFKYHVDLNGKKFYVFSVPLKYRDDVQKLLKGDYTLMSKETKDYICKASGLNLNKKSGVFTDSSTVLQALYSDSPLKYMLAEYLDIRVTELPREMISKIPENSLLFVENYVEEKVI
jgi:hypothetical protein